MSERDLNNTVTPNPKLAIDYCGIKMKNPIIAASGTFGNGPEYAGYLDLSNEVGAISVKGLTLKGRHGNPGPRIAETPSGVLNCIGLENPGAEYFVEYILPDLKKYDVPLLVNVSAGSVVEFAWMAETLSVDGIAGIEVNVSCPNVECEGMAFGVDPKVVEDVTKAVRKVTNKPVIVKLSPNVTDIVEIAKAVEAGGGDGVSLINTLLGMAIDIHRRKPLLGNIYGGLSGPAVKPVALRMVHQVYKAVNIPIIGLGGIMSGTDAIEFMMAGASAVQVGTATMVDPEAIRYIGRQMAGYVEQYNLESINDIVGAVHQ
ncbi:MAG: dihydroorotate dehydrogenase [Veillonella caviae]|uniref:dihydroorotate dehydrogenase n=1 Tax=Veillonella caviae TaxID=248316 RepID=UPI002A91D1A3|nr:dihydroorotate dehydrogenase [Veillonella caviae]MDY5481969.1 dihydroorotate dehydrogenase [Veillonella caviae]